MNPNYIKECIRIVKKHNKHENVIAINRMSQSKMFKPEG
jgi:hypothetical protein